MHYSCRSCFRSTASWISPTSASARSSSTATSRRATRLGQVELAERLGISRTPVREALRRLSAEGLVDSHPNRGFWAAELGLDAVLRRLEVRLILEPGIARLAAERRTERRPRRAASARSRARRRPAPASPPTTPRASSTSCSRARPATTSTSASSTRCGWSRSAAGCSSRRATGVEWQGADVAEHRAIAAAVASARRRRRRALMEAHVRAAVQHWEDEQQHRRVRRGAGRCFDAVLA